MGPSEDSEPFYREYGLDTASLESEEAIFHDKTPSLEGLVEKAALVHTISMEIDEEAPGSYHRELRLVTQAHKDGDAISEHGVMMSGSISTRNFSSRNEFGESLELALADEFTSAFTDEHGKKYAFVPATDDSSFRPGAKLMLLVTNVAAAENLRNEVATESENPPKINQYYERKCDVFLALMIGEASPLIAALQQECEFEDEFLTVLKRRERNKLSGGRIVVPGIAPVTF